VTPAGAPTLSRRAFTLAAAAGLVTAPAFAQAIPQPVIVAEGGSAEERIEDTRAALDLAITQGCDFIQVNLVPSKEGALVARRGPELSASTNVASHPEFAGRKTTKTIAGADVAGWFAEDFTVPELKTLTCREPLPALRPQNVRYEGKEPILTLPEVLQLARDGCVRTGRTVGVCVRLMHPGAYQDQGVDVVGRLASELATEGYVARAAAIWVQASEPEALRSFGRASPMRRMLIVGADGGADAAKTTTAAGLGDVKSYADAIGADQDLLLDPSAASFPAPTTLAMDAHNAGLAVFSRTARGENAMLPPALRQGDPHWRNYPSDRGDIDKLLVALFADRLDGVCTDLPEPAGEARRQVMDALRRAARPKSS
jgi:glycerophosphoryl diester phosphodiesterase